MSHDLSDLEKEKSILRAVRKTLAQVVVDVTPDSSALRSPLEPKTIEDIRMCFGLISAREREIMELMQRTNNDRPHFIDEPTKVNNVVSFNPSARQTSVQGSSDSGDEG
jgi:hypothetical protein